jgi:aminopeptidase N
MAGFYRSKYTPKGEVPASVARDNDFHYMFSTQFESCDARRAFPCFDEPNLKATFDVELEVPKDQIALSNMPEKEIKSSKRDGFHTVVFGRTPVMSTYLLAWAIGDFEYVEAFTERKYNGKSIPVRVYTTKGLKEQGRFALDNCHKVVDYFSEVFQIDYPLPKVDLLAVHEFVSVIFYICNISADLVANYMYILLNSSQSKLTIASSHTVPWRIGVSLPIGQFVNDNRIDNRTYSYIRTTAVLFDPATSADSYRNELAHQWFGNLVTMDWWNELWLNEGFATWVGWLAIDHLYPGTWSIAYL